MDGWIKLHRKVLDNPVVCKDAETLAIWIYLLTHATHAEMAMLFGGKKTTLKPGQLITGRKSIASKLKISESKVQRTLKLFEIEQQIEQRTDRQSRLVSVVNWGQYQQSEQQSEQGLNNDRTTSEQRLNTNKNVKNAKNVKNEKKYGAKPQRPRFVKPTIEEIQSYCHERNNGIDAQHFFDYYEARGWELSKGRKIKDWKACVRTWERSGFNSKPKPSPVEERGGMGEWIE